ncbi:MAG: hypothetical protein AAFN50_01545 [Pseudomonadota bacterium]
MSDAAYSVVTAILPNTASDRVAQSLATDAGATALTWRARGTLLRDHWWARWMPPIGPVKTTLQLLVHKDDVDRIQTTIIDSGRLHQQATGAVFSTPCQRAFFGTDSRVWSSKLTPSTASAAHRWSENLSIICCIVGQTHSERVARAAVNAGAHGPVIYFSEGRGLRDRIGWLRITKEHDQEVLLVLADNSQASDVFSAMAKAGEVDRPGRGIMYRMDIDKGMFNLPSRFTGHRDPASMRQIIHAIDQLAGHKHWRDQGAYDPGNGGRSTGPASFGDNRAIFENRQRLTAIAPREQLQTLTDAILDAGAPGINMTFARLLAPVAGNSVSSARINDEYAVLRSILEPQVMEQVYKTLCDRAEDNDTADLCVFTNDVPQMATYAPGLTDYRAPNQLLAASS